MNEKRLKRRLKRLRPGKSKKIKILGKLFQITKEKDSLNQEFDFWIVPNPKNAISSNYATFIDDAINTIYNCLNISQVA